MQRNNTSDKRTHKIHFHLSEFLPKNQVYVNHNKLVKGEDYARSALFSYAANRDMRRVDGSIECLKNILTLQDRQEEADQILVQVLKIALGAGHQRTIGAMKDLASRPWQYTRVHDGVHAALLYEEIIASETKLLTCNLLCQFSILH